jgi:hypothetical protein
MPVHYKQPSPPKISLLSKLWIVIPIIVPIFAILSNNLLLRNNVHIFNAVLWTGTDIFMAFLKCHSINTKRGQRLAYAKDGILHANHCCCYNDGRLFSCLQFGPNYLKSTCHLLDRHSLSDCFR